MKAEEKKEITFTLNAEEALKLYAYLADDDSIPWGISDGQKVATKIKEKLSKFLNR
jgi:hypothetical protein